MTGYPSSPGPTDPRPAPGASVGRAGGSTYGSNSAGRLPSGVKSVAKPPRGRKPPKIGKNGTPRGPLWTKIVIIFGTLALVAAGTAMIFVNTIVNDINNSFKTVNLLGDTGATGHPIDGAINMLLVGLDTRANNPSLGSRADSIIIAHVPASHDRVYLISIPRDTSADIPPFPLTGFNGGSYKVNASFFFGSQGKGGISGGFQLLALTLKQMTGISFDAGLIINFDGFTDIVNKLGGVTMYVDEETMSLHHGYVTGHPNEAAKPWVINSDGTPNRRIPGTTPVVYHKGTQHLSAYQALDYVRCRDFLPFTDYDRQRHQQQFIKALLQEAYDKGINNPTKISDFLSSLGKAFTFDPGQDSPGHPRQVSDWIFTLKGISPGSIVTIKTNDGKYVHYTGQAPDDRQALSPDSMTLLRDVTTDTVDNFIATHPDWVA
jgi:LCP family protein required for cell wall assembly